MGSDGTDNNTGRDRGSGLKLLAILRISVGILATDAVAVTFYASYTDMDSLDEYTALQKYISTYRDPKAVSAEDGEVKEEKKKPAWKVSLLSTAFTWSASLTATLVLGQGGEERRRWHRSRRVAQRRHQAGH